MTDLIKAADALVESEDEWRTWNGVAKIRTRCEQVAKSEGLAGLELFFRSQKLFSKCLSEKTTYRERQTKWLSKQHPTNSHLRDALKAIADGHNDPRALAVEVLAGYEARIKAALEG